MKDEIKIDSKNSQWRVAYFLFVVIFFFGFSLLIFIWRNVHTVQKYPIVFGDEGLHMKIAKEFARRKEFLHYIDFFKPNEPAYHYISVFHFLEAFGFLFSEWFARIILPLIVFLSGFSIFVIFWKLFDEKIALLSAILFQTFQSTAIYAVTFYVDSLLVLFTFLSFGFIFLFDLEGKRKYLLLSSVFLALSFLTKPLLPLSISFGIFLALFLFLLSKKVSFKDFLIFLLISFLPIFIILSVNSVVYNKICANLWFISNFLNRYLDGSCELKRIDYRDIYSFSGRTEMQSSELDVFSFGLREYIEFAYGNASLLIILSSFGIIHLLFSRKIQLLAPSFSVFLLTIVWLIIFYTTSRDLGILYRTEDTTRYLYFFNPFVALYSSLFLYFIRDVFSLFFLEDRRVHLLEKIFILFFIFLLILISFRFIQSYDQKIFIMQRLKTFSHLFFEACEWIKKNVEENSTLMSLWSYRVLYNCDRNVGGSADLRLSRDASFIKNLAKKLGVDYFFIEKFSIDPLNRKLAERYDLEWVELLFNSKDNFEVIYENGIPFERCKEEYLRRGNICDGVIIFKVK